MIKDEEKQRFIKEFAAGRFCIVRTDCYAHTLAFFNELFEEAKKDFPNLKPEECRVEKYAGREYAGTFGIEFERRDAPGSYRRIKEVELVASSGPPR
jgi:hypothetical protein